MQLEFRELSRASGDPKYGRAATAALRLILQQAAASPIQFLLPENLYVRGAKPKDGDIQVDGGADSYYEYLLKLWIQGGKQESRMKRFFDNTVDRLEAVAGVKFEAAGPGKEELTMVGRVPWPAHLANRRSSGPGSGDPASLTTEDLRRTIDPIAGHLSCFFPGTLALSTRGMLDGATGAENRRRLDFAEELMHTCYQLYNRTLAGLGGDYFGITDEKGLVISDYVNKLRPEVVESLMYLWRVTGKQKYRQWGWQIFSALERWAKMENGGSVHPLPMPPPSFALLRRDSLAVTARYSGPSQKHMCMGAHAW